MLFDKLSQSGIHRGVFAVLLAIMWLMPIVLGWMAYEAAHHHMKLLSVRWPEVHPNPRLTFALLSGTIPP
jgi:hypothetical protein